MKIKSFVLIILLSIFSSNISFAKDPSSLIIEIVDEAASILSSGCGRPVAAARPPGVGKQNWAGRTKANSSNKS